jgi:hypothetical protein
LAKNKSLLDNVALAFADDPAEYGKVYKQFISKNRDADGNILDDKKEQDMVIALRKAYETMDHIEYCELTERIINIENFGVSEELQAFIDLTKRFVVAVEKEPKKLLEFLPYWESRANISIKDLSFQNHLKSDLVNQVYNYLGKVESDGTINSRSK